MAEEPNTRPTTNDKLTGFRKRQQLTKTNKRTFAWVIGASVGVTVCIVVAQFLVQQALFNQKIIAAKTEAQTIVKQNQQNAPLLKDKIDGLAANADLAKVKVSAGSQGQSNNLQVILDALPAGNDNATFANSLATAIFPRSGVTVDSLSVGEGQNGGALTPVTTPSSEGGVTPLNFIVTISGNQSQLRQALVDITKVIRPIKITQINLQGDAASLKLTITGTTYSLPAANVNVEKTKSIEP